MHYHDDDDYQQFFLDFSLIFLCVFFLCKVFKFNAPDESSYIKLMDYSQKRKYVGGTV